MEENQNVEMLNDDWDIDVNDIPEDDSENIEEETEVEEVDTPVETETEVETNEEVKNEEEKTNEVATPEFELEIVHNGETKKLTKEEATALSQKGLDYDRIRPIYDFVKELADEEGKSVDEYVKSTNENLKDFRIKQLAEEKGVSEEIARELYESRVAKNKLLASEKEKAKESEDKEKLNADIKSFQAAHPEITDFNSIPKEVWNEVQKGTPLQYAYDRYELEQLKKENSILKTNAKNKEQEVTTGTQANSKAKDIYDEAWDLAD